MIDSNDFNSYFRYKDGVLHCEDVSIETIAKKVGTPFYLYSKKAIIDKINEYKEAFKDYPTIICYAAKANSNLSILKIFQENDIGCDIVSGGELYKAKKAGIPSNKIVYAGVGKTDFEIEFAIRENILSFNVESYQEIEVINSIAEKVGKVARISIRVNPDVDPKTHPYISTGMKKSKFGIDIDEALNIYKKAMQFKNIEIIGVHCHIGSQIMSISPYIEAVSKVAELVDKLKKEGIELKYFDIGGGIGIKYKITDEPPNIKDFANAIIPIVKQTGLNLIIEPGRSLIGEAGALITKVLFLKDKKEKHFVIVDSGMNDLVRPSIYDAYHHIMAVKIKDKTIKADIVGPICESGDFLGIDREICQVERGDLVAVMSAGAYGASMSSNYNVRPRALEVLVDNNNFKIIREREDYNYLIKLEEEVIQ
ncbi:diaminopimelate decarboxylase [Venenivibrio stagnispumantis]|uniref:Diaminopimelate decarboxylase n=1 Tax=Venenivibrio stagnispumantis TaxID=407998 RepID=A0AA45WID3_9AQUI|nr:diaminopimelate decarboxylase [Venenivibrio stagnispumantis]MCW4572771.1 diaminopimelate decarboxylase [Venenivibrio stagnispumantis]SMP00329.1 diaminopimelate decarboxylase [Venenivibrio stagnispumantis]